MGDFLDISNPTRADLLVRVLRQTGPTLSSIVASKMMRIAGISAENARKIIQRGAHGVASLKRIKFPHNERFLYFRSEFGSPAFWQALIRTLEEERTTYGVALSALDAHQNIISEKRFHIISGSPALLKRHLSSKRVLSNLIDIGLLERNIISGTRLITVASRTELPTGTYQGMKARAVAEEIALTGLKDWARKMGIASFHSVQVRGRNKNPLFGQFEWDLSAPSFVYPFRVTGGGKPKPGFLVADAVLGCDVKVKHLGYFVQKATVLLNQPNTRPFMAMLLADRFQSDALYWGRKLGLVLATPEILFGEIVAKGLQELIRSLGNAAVVAKEDPVRIAELFSRLQSIESSAESLRGPLFEMIVAYVVSSDGGWIEVGKVIKDPESGQSAEFDVLQVKRDGVNAIECKAHLSGHTVTLEEVKDWLQRQVPRLHRYLVARHSGIPYSFQFWTTGTIKGDAEAFLQERKLSTKKYGLSWKEYKDVVSQLQRLRAKRLKDVLKEYYTTKTIDEKRGLGVAAAVIQTTKN